MGDRVAPSMSLSRRFLSMPQELLGCSLPPKVRGKCCGTLTLCIPHILPSAVSSLVLPRMSLVRVRWWGEETSGSLFRPLLLANDGKDQVTEDDEAPARAIAMNYPICVLPEQLWDYFQDVQHLTLDVIDRDTRRKYGECLFSLDSHRDNAVMTAEEKIVALRQENALLEIRPSSGDHVEVLGYLAVTFHVEWKHSEKMEDSDFLVQIDELLTTDEDKVDTLRDAPMEDKREVSSVTLSPWKQLKASDSVHLAPLKSQEQVAATNEKREQQETARASVDFQRICRLLDKGKALQESMEMAVKGDFDENQQKTKDTMLLNPYVNIVDTWQVEHHDMSVSNVSPSMHCVPHAPNVFEHDENMTIESTSLDHCSIHGLTLTFQALELDPQFVAHHLRQLRDASSVSSRFSPIQLHVFHDDVAALHDTIRPNLPPISAFSVTTSLRKWQWHLNCSSRMTLTQPMKVERSNRRIRFLVQCENQNEILRNKKRKKAKLGPLSSKCVLLEGGVDVDSLFSIVGKANNPWTTNVELYKVEKEGGTLRSIHGPMRQNKQTRKKKELSVGFLKVQFLLDESTSSDESDRDESESDGVLPSISSSAYEGNQPYQPQVLDTDIKSWILPQVESSDHKDELPDSQLLQFAVMFGSLRAAAWESDGFDPSCATETYQCQRGERAKVRELPHIALHYAVPSQFTRVSSCKDKFERTIRRTLKGPRWLDHGPRLQADFSGQVHVFQSSFAKDASEYFAKSFMIVEAWRDNAKDADRTLFGLVKVPLESFATFLRCSRRDFVEQILPFVGVDGTFPVENPFTGHRVGVLQARACVGTAEQVLALATTIHAIVKLQGVVRGFQSRKHFRSNHFDGICRVCGFSSSATSSTSCVEGSRYERVKHESITYATLGDTLDKCEEREQAQESEKSSVELLSSDDKSGDTSAARGEGERRTAMSDDVDEKVDVRDAQSEYESLSNGENGASLADSCGKEVEEKGDDSTLRRMEDEGDLASFVDHIESQADSSDGRNDGENDPDNGSHGIDLLETHNDLGSDSLVGIDEWSQLPFAAADADLSMSSCSASTSEQIARLDEDDNEIELNAAEGDDPLSHSLVSTEAQDTQTSSKSIGAIIPLSAKHSKVSASGYASENDNETTSSGRDAATNTQDEREDPPQVSIEITPMEMVQSIVEIPDTVVAMPCTDPVLYRNAASFGTKGGNDDGGTDEFEDGEVSMPLSEVIVMTTVADVAESIGTTSWSALAVYETNAEDVSSVDDVDSSGSAASSVGTKECVQEVQFEASAAGPSDGSDSIQLVDKAVQVDSVEMDGEMSVCEIERMRSMKEARECEESTGFCLGEVNSDAHSECDAIAVSWTRGKTRQVNGEALESSLLIQIQLHLPHAKDSSQHGNTWLLTQGKEEVHEELVHPTHEVSSLLDRADDCDGHTVIDGQEEEDFHEGTSTRDGLETHQGDDTTDSIDLFELERQIEGASSCVRPTECVKSDNDSESSADVDCDAMSGSQSSRIDQELKSEALHSSLATEQQLQVKNEDVIEQVNDSKCAESELFERPLSDGTSARELADCGAIIAQTLTHFEATHASRQMEKLEQMFEMLRELRDGYFTNDRHREELKENEISKTMESEDGKDFRGSNASECVEDTNVFQLVDTQIPVEPQENAVQEVPKSLDQRGSRNSSIECTAKRSLTASCYDANETERHCRTDAMGHVATSWTDKASSKTWSEFRTKETPSFASSFFPGDSETERIARIMQGTVNYWRNDDSCSSHEDEDDEMEENCYF